MYYCAILEKDASEKYSAEQICEIEVGNIDHRNTAAIWLKRFNKDGTSLVDKKSKFSFNIILINYKCDIFIFMI